MTERSLQYNLGQANERRNTWRGREKLNIEEGGRDCAPESSDAEKEEARWGLKGWMLGPARLSIGKSTEESGPRVEENAQLRTLEKTLFVPQSACPSLTISCALASQLWAIIVLSMQINRNSKEASRLVKIRDGPVGTLTASRSARIQRGGYWKSRCSGNTSCNTIRLWVRHLKKVCARGCFDAINKRWFAPKMRKQEYNRFAGAGHGDATDDLHPRNYEYSLAEFGRAYRC